MKKSYKDILKRADKAKLTREKDWLPLYEKAWKYVAPSRQMFSRSGVQFSQLWEQIYDSTAIRASKSLADQLAAGMTPAWQKFARFEPGALVPKEEREEMRVLLESATEKFFMHLNLSNFAQEAHSAYLDCTFGTGCLTVEPHPSGRGVVYGTIPLAELMIREDGSGVVNNIYRYYKLTAQAIMEKYPDAKLDDRLRQEMLEKPEVEHEIIRALEPKPDTERFIDIIVIDRGKDQGEKVELEITERDENPYIGFRWSVIPGTAYGQGPALESYHDIKMLNKLKELFLRNIALGTAGVYLGRGDMTFNPGALTLQPGTIIPVKKNDRNAPALTRLDVGADMNVAMLGLDQLRSDINAAFLVDQLGGVDGPHMTATEVIERSKIIAQKLGATYARLEREFLMPMIRKTVKILMDQGELPEGMDVDGEIVDVVFVSNLAQAQRLTEVDSIIQLSSLQQQLAESDPNVGRVLDLPEVVREVGRLMYIKQDLIRTKDQVEEEMESALQGAALGQEEMAAMQGGPDAGLPTDGGAGIPASPLG